MIGFLRKVKHRIFTGPNIPFAHRTKIAKKFLKGSGIEIGGLHEPVKLGKYINVKYVDLHSREDSIRRFPELDPNKIIHVDIIDNGFELGKIDNNSIDFIIANHVLEHAPNLYGTLDVWTNKLRLNGILYLGIPVASECFDRGRPITSLEHISSDYELYNQNNIDQIIKRNQDHLREFIKISKKNIALDRNEEFIDPSDEAVELDISTTNMETLDIHFHTFSKDSLTTLLQFYCKNINPLFELIYIEQFGGELITLLKRTATS